MKGGESSGDLPSMFREILTDDSAAAIIAKSPAESTFAMLLARKLFEVRKLDRRREFIPPDRWREAPWDGPDRGYATGKWTASNGWAYALATRTDLAIDAAQVRRWESGADPVSAGVVATALAIVDLAPERVLMAAEDVAEWAALLGMLVEHLRPGYVTSPDLLTRSMCHSPGQGRTWRGVVGVVAKTSKDLKRIENLMRAAMADAERLRFLALAAGAEEEFVADQPQ